MITMHWTVIVFLILLVIGWKWALNEDNDFLTCLKRIVIMYAVTLISIGIYGSIYWEWLKN